MELLKYEKPQSITSTLPSLAYQQNSSIPGFLVTDHTVPCHSGLQGKNSRWSKPLVADTQPFPKAKCDFCFLPWETLQTRYLVESTLPSFLNAIFLSIKMQSMFSPQLLLFHPHRQPSCKWGNLTCFIKNLKVS